VLLFFNGTLNDEFEVRIQECNERQCMYNVTLKCIHVTFIPATLSQQSDNISLEHTFYGDVMLLETIRNN